MKFGLLSLLIALSFLIGWGHSVQASAPELPGTPSLSQTQSLLTNIDQTYGSYVGGNSDDRVRAVTVDEQGNIYLTGSTYSTDFPGGSKPNSDEDLFVMRLNPEGTAVIWTTYLSGSGSEAGHALALDGQGSLWVTGYTDSSDFPVSPGSNSFAGYYDIVAAKFNTTTGAKQYSALYGGENLDQGNGIAISATTGQVYITGQLSDEFNRSNVLIMALDGQNYDVQGPAYFGREQGRDAGYAIALDTADNVYITGETQPFGQDTDFPVTVDAFQTECGLAGSSGECSPDGFITILTPDISDILYSSYIGGSYDGSPSGFSSDASNGIAVGADGTVYLTGYTFATDFPVANAIQPTKRGAENFPDAFVMALNPTTNELLFSTYLGGDDWEEGHAITLDEQGNVYIAGMTNALNFPTQNAPQPTLGGGTCGSRYCYDAFATKLTASGGLDWSTYLGGTSDDNALALALSTTDGVFLTGETSSSNFPVSENALQPDIGGSPDGFLTLFGSSVTPPPADFQIYLPVIIE